MLPMKTGWICLVLSLSLLVWFGNAIELAASETAEANSLIPVIKALGGADRYLTSISTDKPIYRAGEYFHARGVMLTSTEHKPMPDRDGHNSNLIYANVNLENAKGQILVSRSIPIKDSVWGVSLNLPVDQESGQYRIYVSYPNQGYAPAERRFEVRSYRAPRLNSQIVFLRDGYGPGDEVTATLKVKRAEGGIPTGAEVEFIPRVDGKAISGGTTRVDESGICTASFKLPNTISEGYGTLAFSIKDGGVVENASKSIPILLNTVKLDIYPEGGELVSGLSNRVYLQAYQSNGKPADLAGALHWKEDKATGVVCDFRTEHEGRGRIEFVPRQGRNYYLSLSEPAGIKKTYPLPELKGSGVVIRSMEEVYKKDEPVKVKVAATADNGSVLLTLKKREEVVAYKKIKLKGDKLKEVSFFPSHEFDGVLTVTAWSDDDKPLAERLVFREPAQKLNIKVEADKKSYIPGDKVTLAVKATDESGKPAATVVGLNVTDDSILELLDNREKAPRLPVMVYLEPEVADLADAAVYLDSENPKAELATDLLLGTQGWRRFALIDVEKFLKEHGDKARRALAYRGNDLSNLNQVDRYTFYPDRFSRLKLPKGGLQLPEEIGRVEGPRDMNMFQVEPTVLDERHYTTGRAVRHQKTSPTLPEGVPLPDLDNNRLVNARIGEVTVYAREYAHHNRGRRGTDRKDFTETIYWNPVVKTDATTGEAKVSFDLSDSVTTFKAIVDGFTQDGTLGSTEASIEAVNPFYAEAKLPLEVTEGDRILLPLNLVNSTSDRLEALSFETDLNGDSVVSSLSNARTDLGAGERLRCLQPIEVGKLKGSHSFTIVARAGQYKDRVERKLSVKPRGFPQETGIAGLLKPNQSVEKELLLSQEIVPGSLEVKGALYATPVGQLNAALERMILDPYGCFEQCSSTSYPLTMAQQYFLSHSNVDPSWIERSREKLTDGYKRLVSYWCPDRGYEWFGHNPGHEALTAFGLMHFKDMAKVREVDQKMVSTTRAWLMKQKDGKGGFNHRTRGLHNWTADSDSSNTYIVWALLESGEPISSLKNELERVKTVAFKSDDSYVIALGANALYMGGEKAAASQLMKRLAERQLQDGSVDKAKNSIVGSNGNSLKVEGTALASLAWLRDQSFSDNLVRSMKYLTESCRSGRYGSTQATVLALKAIVAYDKMTARVKAPGRYRVSVDGKPVGNWIAFDEKAEGELKLPDIGNVLKAGKHKITLTMEGGAPMPFSLVANYNTPTPVSSDKCKVSIDVKLAETKVREGATVDTTVILANLSKDSVPSPLAIVGIPGGLEPRYDQLKELVKKETIDAYEVKGRELVLYWRGLQAGEKVVVPINLVAAVPGTYKGTASRAYLYYGDENKHWLDGLDIEIIPKKVEIASGLNSESSK